jgi:hypothetical protein
MEETNSILNCEASQLLLLDHSVRPPVLKTKVAAGLPMRTFPSTTDVMGEVISLGELSNIHDITRTKFYKPDVHNNYLGTEIDVRTVLCVPLFNTDDQIIGVIEAINKKSNQMFRTDDIEVLTNIASHVALNIEGDGSSIRKILHFSRTQ